MQIPKVWTFQTYFFAESGYCAAEAHSNRADDRCRKNLPKMQPACVVTSTTPPCYDMQGRYPRINRKLKHLLLP